MKSHQEFRDEFVSRTGYPSLGVPSGVEWLDQMVKTSAKAACQYQDTLIANYDLSVMLNSPPNGFAPFDKEIIEGLIGHSLWSGYREYWSAPATKRM